MKNKLYKTTLTQLDDEVNYSGDINMYAMQIATETSFFFQFFSIDSYKNK